MSISLRLRICILKTEIQNQKVQKIKEKQNGQDTHEEFENTNLEHRQEIQKLKDELIQYKEKADSKPYRRKLTNS